MYFSLEKSISSPTDLWRYIGNHPEKFNHCMRREMRAGLEEDSDGAGARRFFRFPRRFRVSLPHHVPVVTEVIKQRAPWFRAARNSHANASDFSESNSGYFLASSMTCTSWGM
jgi:hypothetical protein